MQLLPKVKFSHPLSKISSMHILIDISESFIHLVMLNANHKNGKCVMVELR